MGQTQKHLLFAEFINAGRYLERILQGIIHYSDLSSDMEVRKICKKLHFELHHYLEQNILNPDCNTDDQLKFLGPKEILKEYQDIIKLIEALIKINLNQIYINSSVVGIVNLIYNYAYQIHLQILQKSKLVIDYPRVNLTRIIKNKSENSLPKFQLDGNDLKEWGNDSQTSIASLDFKRMDQYKELLKDGHKHIHSKNFKMALKSFTKACRYNETAEILSLIGWANYLSGDTKQAKDFCLRAIKQDPDFGPPYNDMGSFLLSEGQTNESLKWFELAKKCSNYQHREYPYINCGRAYVNKKDYANALSEFEKALSFAPYNKELKQTIDNIKLSIKKPHTITDTNRHPHLD